MALDKATWALLIWKAPTWEVIAFGERTWTVARVWWAEEMSLSAKTMGLIRKIVLDNFWTDH